MLEEYELLVIGGGIIGVSCAYEASQRGVKVLLVDKSDFGSKTSQGSFKIVHGGLRYLQHLDFPRLRESVKCQNYIRRFAPHLVKTLPFIVPCYGYGMKGREILSLACEIYGILSCDRNKGISSEQVLPRYQVLSVDELIKIAPYVERTNLRGGVVFFDSQMLDPDRLLLHIISSAERNGAYFENYQEITSISSVTDGYSATVKNLISGSTREIKTRYVINAMGPFASRISQIFGQEKDPSSYENIFSKGIQIGIRDFPVSKAISIQTKGIDTAASINRGGRAIFLQPWRDFTLVGTTDTIFKGNPDTFSIEDSEIENLFEEIKNAYPDPNLVKSKISFSFGGLRPIDPRLKGSILSGENRDGLVNTSRDEDLIDHDQDYPDWGLKTLSNVVSIVGIKYTTSRSVAVKVLDLLSKKGLTTKNRGADYFNFAKVTESSKELNSISETLAAMNSSFQYDKLSQQLWETYGKHTHEFLTHVKIKSVKDYSEVLKIVEKEMILNSITNEHAKKMQDIMVRRFSRKLYSAENSMFLGRVSEIYSNELGKKQEEISAELEEIKKYFPR